MTIPSNVRTLIEEGRIAIRGLIKFQFGGGTYGVWNGKGDLLYDTLDGAGATYVANSLIAVDDLAQGLGTAAERWSRLVRQFGGSAKVDRVRFYAANCSVICAVA